MITSGRAACRRDESTTAGLRLRPVTPGKSATTKSPALVGKRMLLRIGVCGVPQRERRNVPNVLMAPGVAEVEV